MMGRNRMLWACGVALVVACGGLTGCGDDEEGGAATNELAGAVWESQEAEPLGANVAVAGKWSGTMSVEGDANTINLTLSDQHADGFVGGTFTLHQPGISDTGYGEAAGQVSGDEMRVSLYVKQTYDALDLDGMVNAAGTVFSGMWYWSGGSGRFQLQKK